MEANKKDKMNYNSFGEVLYYFRKEMHLTQEELCKGICNRRTYMKWENNQLLPSFYHMECLSQKLNIDLFFYYKIFQSKNNSIFIQYDIKVRNFIETGQYRSVKELIPEMEQTGLKSPHFEQLISLCRIIGLLEEKNFELSLEHCLLSLSDGKPSPAFEYPYGRIFSNAGMNILICLAFSYSNLKMENKALEIYLTAFQFIERRLLSDLRFYQSYEYEKKIYLYILYNISSLYLNRKNYSESLDYIQKALIFSKKEHCLYFLPELFELKLDLHYLLGNYSEAYESYHHAVCLYRLQNKYSESEHLEQNLRIKYSILQSLEQQETK